jgi:hypothetical protein
VWDWVLFGRIADVVTVIAGLIAIAGVLWAVLSQAKLSVSEYVSSGPNPTLTLTIASTGSLPVHDLTLSVGALDDNGFSMWGDGGGMRPALSRGESLVIQADEAGSGGYGGHLAHRHEMKPGEGFYLTVQYRHPLFPWRRKSATYAWPPSLRFASRPPKRLVGRAESRFFKRTQDQRINPSQPGFTKPSWAPATAIVATDENFPALLEHKGPVVVGFGPAAQGEFWVTVQRMLHAFAANYAARVKVVIVTIEKCPKVAADYPSSTVPYFKLFRAGKVVASHSGAGSMRDFEKAFAEHLK